MEDVDGIYGLGQSLFNQEELSFGWTHDRIGVIISESHSYLIEKNGCVLGFCLASSVCTYAEGCHIEWTAVAADVRGLGARLFLHVLIQLKNSYDRLIFVDVRPTNSVVLNMLQRYGFKRYTAVGPFEILALGMIHSSIDAEEKLLETHG
jgi:ribosomal protein S18 acetylase RimI-like enzyme